MSETVDIIRVWLETGDIRYKTVRHWGHVTSGHKRPLQSLHKSMIQLPLQTAGVQSTKRVHVTHQQQVVRQQPFPDHPGYSFRILFCVPHEDKKFKSLLLFCHVIIPTWATALYLATTGTTGRHVIIGSHSYTRRL